jgi:hypothetical protein
MSCSGHSPTKVERLPEFFGLESNSNFIAGSESATGEDIVRPGDKRETSLKFCRSSPMELSYVGALIVLGTASRFRCRPESGWLRGEFSSGFWPGLSGILVRLTRNL